MERNRDFINGFRLHSDDIQQFMPRMGAVQTLRTIICNGYPSSNGFCLPSAKSHCRHDTDVSQRQWQNARLAF
jgi:hypothetical protein